MKTEAVSTLASAPEIVVQRVAAGRHDLIPISYADQIRKFPPGVKAVIPRIWGGYYYDSLIKANLTLIGIGQNREQLELLEGRLPSAPNECAIGMGGL